MRKGLHVSWDFLIIDNWIKKQCECQFCYVCSHNRYQCGIFGKYKCICYNEWRCGMCINIRTSTCNYCNRR